jgi:hypothetical protein
MRVDFDDKGDADARGVGVVEGVEESAVLLE